MEQEKILMKQKKILNEIKKYIWDMVEKYGDKVSPEDLDNNGAIYYMNGNDGTHFDFCENGRTCEFMVFHKNERGFIKASLFRDGRLFGYLWNENGNATAIELDERFITSREEAKEFAEYLQKTRDDFEIWDEIILENGRKAI